MPKQMPIYKAEAEAGIADAISATENHVIASLCPLLADDQVVASVQNETDFLNLINNSIKDKENG